MFASFFGRKKKCITREENVSASQTIINLKNNILMQEKREKHLEKKICNYKNEARKYLKGDKKKAINFLKKVKSLQKQLDNLCNIKYNIENQIYTLEDGIVNIENIKCMKDGLRAIKNINKETDPDEVGELMDEIAEEIETSREIGETLSHPLGEVNSDEELLRDFLEEESENKKIELDLPQVPKKSLKEKEEEELAILTKEILC